jgi:hypothetical protein
MKDRQVLLAFDGDGVADATHATKGRMATRKWAEALEAAGANVRILPIPEGKDLSTAGDINTLIAQAQPLVKPPTGIEASPSGYVRSGGKEPTSISNWIFVPKRALRGDGSLAFEGILKPGGDTAVIRTTDLASDNALVKWCGKYGRAWMGTSNDARKLLALLQAEAVFLPTGFLVTVVGLHGDTFVWPGGQLGPAPIVYVPPAADIRLEEKIHIRPGPWDTDLIHDMRAVQARAATDPFLAWLAVAPLRTLMPGKKFPFIAVTGDYGSGKSETTRLLVQLFCGSQIEETFTSTPHALRSAFSASNAMTVLAGERRKGAREDTMIMGDQLLRQAWNMQVSQMGGLATNWAELTDVVPSAPIVVEGEDMFAEGSHVERMVPLYLLEEGKNSEVFGRLSLQFDRRTGALKSGFPYAWLSYLQTLIASGAFDDLDITEHGPSSLADRQRYTLGVLHFGWSLLQSFMAEYGDNLDAPDFSAIIAKYETLNKQTPVEEALKFCLGNAEAYGKCIHMETTNGVKEVWVDVPLMFAFIQDPRRAGLFVLPGRVPFLKSHLETKFGAEVRNKDFREFSVFPLERIAK